MADELPTFKYHPDPVATGLIVVGDSTCKCCARARGYIYRGPIYAVAELDEALCPWCIADGSAAIKFAATFTDEQCFAGEGLDLAIVSEVTQRTPGYVGWQQEVWRVHCDDACAYHGFPTPAELTENLAGAVAELIEDLGLSDKQWRAVRDAFVPGGYQPQGHVGLYKFRCIHCDTDLLACDSN